MIDPEKKILSSSLYYFGNSYIAPITGSVSQIEFPNGDQHFLTYVICGQQTIFVLDDKNVLWGLGSTLHGQLGIVTDALQQIPLNISDIMGGRHFQQISCGDNHVVGLSSTNPQISDNYQIHMWGENKHQQLNLELSKEDQKPIEVSKRINAQVSKVVAQHFVQSDETDLKIKKLQFSYNFVCCSQQHTFLIIEGILFAFGRDLKNRLGLKQLDQIKQVIFFNKKDEVYPILQVPIKHKVVGISASQTHTLAWTESGHLYSWGDAKDGKLGRKFSTEGWVSVEEVGRVQNLDHEFISMAVCGLSYSVALTRKGKIYGWGRASRFQSEAESPCVVDIVLPIELSPVLQSKTDMHAKFVKVVAGQTHYAALDVLGRIFTWGENIDQCLGLFVDQEDLLQPTEVQFDREFKIIDVDLGLNFTTFIALNGKPTYESSFQKNIKENSQSHLKVEMQLIKSYTKSKNLLFERRKSMISDDPKQANFKKSSTQLIVLPATRPSTQQLQTQLWGLLEQSQSKSRLQTTGEKYRINSSSLRYLKKNFGDSYCLKNGEIQVIMDQTVQKLQEKQRVEPMYLSIRQEGHRQSKQTSNTYKFDSADFYTQPVGKEFNPIKKDLLKYQYIEMIRNGHEDRHLQYIFDDKPHFWKPQEMFIDKTKMKQSRKIASQLVRNSDMPIKNYVTRAQEHEILQNIHECIDRAKKIINPPSKTFQSIQSRYKNPQKNLYQ